MFEVDDVACVVGEFAEVLRGDEVVCFVEGRLEFVAGDADVGNEEVSCHVSEIRDESPVAVGRDDAFGFSSAETTTVFHHAVVPVFF